MIRQAAGRTGDVIGDGSSTSSILVQTISGVGGRNVAAGAGALEARSARASSQDCGGVELPGKTLCDKLVEPPPPRPSGQLDPSRIMPSAHQRELARRVGCVRTERVRDQRPASDRKERTMGTRIIDLMPGHEYSSRA